MKKIRFNRHSHAPYEVREDEELPRTPPEKPPSELKASVRKGLADWEQIEVRRGGTLRLSRGERDHIAGHALNSILELCGDLSGSIDPKDIREGDASSCARKIAALSNLLGDIGWERGGAVTAYEYSEVSGAGVPVWFLGELFPVAQLRPWLEEWQHQDDEALVEAEQALETSLLETDVHAESHNRVVVASAQTKLGTGAILLARLEKWMASRGN